MGSIVVEGDDFQMFVVKQSDELFYLVISWNSERHEISVLISLRRGRKKLARTLKETWMEIYEYRNIKLSSLTITESFLV